MATRRIRKRKNKTRKRGGGKTPSKASSKASQKSLKKGFKKRLLSIIQPVSEPEISDISDDSDSDASQTEIDEGELERDAVFLEEKSYVEPQNKNTVKTIFVLPIIRGFAIPGEDIRISFVTGHGNPQHSKAIANGERETEDIPFIGKETRFYTGKLVSVEQEDGRYKAYVKGGPKGELAPIRSYHLQHIYYDAGFIGKPAAKLHRTIEANQKISNKI